MVFSRFPRTVAARGADAFIPGSSAWSFPGSPGRSLLVERTLRFLMRESRPTDLAGLTLQGFRLLQRFLRRADGVAVGTVFCELGYDLDAAAGPGTDGVTNGAADDTDTADARSANRLAQAQFLVPHFARLGETLIDLNQLPPESTPGRSTSSCPDPRPPGFAVFYEYLTWLDSNTGRFVDKDHSFFPLVLGDAVSNSRRDLNGLAELVELCELFEIEVEEVVFRRLDMILWLSGLAEQVCAVYVEDGVDGAVGAEARRKSTEGFAFDSLLDCFGQGYAAVQSKKRWRELLEEGCGTLPDETGASSSSQYGREWRRRVQHLCEDVWLDLVEEIQEAVNDVLAERTGREGLGCCFGEGLMVQYGCGEGTKTM